MVIEVNGRDKPFERDQHTALRLPFPYGPSIGRETFYCRDILPISRNLVL